MRREFMPRSISSLRSGYTKSDFTADLLAGLTVAVIALPLAMAFAIASGVSPERGLYTAIIGGFLMSAFGGSRVQIGGPTGAFVVIVFGVVAKHGYEGLATATLMAGVILVLMGLCRFGRMLKYMPYPVTTGFTSGIAVIIFSSQVKDFFGLHIDPLPAGFLEKWVSYFHAFPATNLYTLAIGTASLLLLIFLRHHAPRIPGAIVAVVLASLIVSNFNLPVETIGTKFGAIPHVLPAPSFSFIQWSAMPELFRDAFTIALLAAIESLLSALIADGMIGDKHLSNCELVGTGIANIGSVFFGGIPVTGAIARTAANIKSGAKSPVSGMLHAAFLLLFMLLLAPLASKIPLATLAAILFIVAWNMSEIDHFRYLLNSPRSDVAVLLITFFLTILVDLTVAVEVGVVLAALLFMKHVADHSGKIGSIVETDQSSAAEQQEPETLFKTQVPQGVEVFQMVGPFFFGVADRIKDVLNAVEKPPKVFILRMRRVPVIDATGLHALHELLLKCRRQSATLLLTGVQPQVLESLKRIGLWDDIGPENICENIDRGLERALKLLQT